jgi:hypothetical protein
MFTEFSLNKLQDQSGAGGGSHSSSRSGLVPTAHPRLSPYLPRQVSLYVYAQMFPERGRMFPEHEAKRSLNMRPNIP